MVVYWRRWRYRCNESVRSVDTMRFGGNTEGGAAVAAAAVVTTDEDAIADAAAAAAAAAIAAVDEEFDRLNDIVPLHNKRPN